MPSETSSFPLFRLPHLALKPVLESMNMNELLELSKISKRMQEFVKSLRLYNNFKLEISFFIDVATINLEQNGVCCFVYMITGRSYKLHKTLPPRFAPRILLSVNVDTMDFLSVVLSLCSRLITVFGCTVKEFNCVSSQSLEANVKLKEWVSTMKSSIEEGAKVKI